jgi:drug/metabolite transporter (DMT)-like permease
VFRLIAIAGIIPISFSAIFFRLADVSPATAGFYRAAYALPVLLLLWLLRADERPGEMRLRAFASGVLLAGDVALWHTSIELIGAGLSTVLANTQVLWVGAAAWVLYRERPTRTAIVAVPVVLVGVALIGGIGSSDAFGDRPGLGAVLGLAAGLFYAGFLLLFRSSTRPGSSPVGPLLDVTLGIATAFALGGWLDPGFELAPTWPGHGWLIALAVLVHTGGWLLISVALPRLASLDTSLMLLIQPALTVVWAAIIFTERLSPAQWIGTAVVLAGVLATATRGSVRPTEAETQPDP